MLKVSTKPNCRLGFAEPTLLKRQDRIGSNWLSKQYLINFAQAKYPSPLPQYSDLVSMPISSLSSCLVDVKAVEANQVELDK